MALPRLARWILRAQYRVLSEAYTMTRAGLNKDVKLWSPDTELWLPSGGLSDQLLFGNTLHDCYELGRG